MKSRKKALDEEIDVVEEVPDEADLDGDGVVTEEEEEIYSMQILRRLHEDARLLLEQYDDMGNHLEHEDIKGHLVRKCESLVSEIEELEAMAGKHHPDAKALEGGPGDMDLESEEEGMGEEDEDESPDTDEADSGELERPTPEEALEGMETKTLRNMYIKALQSKYKAFPNTNKKPKMGGIGAPKCKLGSPAKSKGIKGICEECKEKGKKECKCGKKDMTKDEALDIEDELEGVQEDLADDVDSTEMDKEEKALEDHEHGKINEAKDFLDEIADTHDWSRDHQMKAFYHHKNMEGIGGQPVNDEEQVATAMGEDEDNPGMHGTMDMDEGAMETKDMDDLEDEDGTGFEEMDKMDDMEEVQRGKGWHKGLSCRKAAAKAGAFFKNLSSVESHQFGPEHREEAIKHAEALSKSLDAAEQMDKADDEEEIQHPDEDDIVGEIGEKSQMVIAQSKAIAKQLKTTKDLTRKILALRNGLTLN